MTAETGCAWLAGAIDWRRSWLAQLHEAGKPVSLALRDGAGVAAALDGTRAADVRFVPADRRPANQPYEVFIRQTRSVPSRDNLHDLFNGLVWLRFPQAKSRLNELQAEQIERDGIGATRGPVRDALTVFDENGAILQAPDELWNALAIRDWRRLFLELRPLWRQARLVPFGHALLEKLCRPRKSITSHVLRVTALASAPDELDTAVARSLERGAMAGKPFVPLPVLGVPGWWPENDDPSFYDDTDVFRPLRSPQRRVELQSACPHLMQQARRA